MVNIVIDRTLYYPLGTLSIPNMSISSPNGVNELLHRKRGEQFRQQQNVRKSRSHVSSNLVHNKPTLPIGLSFLTHELDALYIPQTSTEEEEEQRRREEQNIYLSPAWRADALAPLYSSLGVRIAAQRILPLSVMCLLPLITSCSISELKRDVLPFIPQHLRKEVVRYTAVRQPLSNSRLFSLYEEEGHSDGELIVVGPNASIRDDYFIQLNQGNIAETDMPFEGEGSSIPAEDDDISDWECDDTSSKLLQTFAALSTRISMSTILTLPPTLTHLALIHVSSPIALHRLPKTCPLLAFLDMSYNHWLVHPAEETVKSIARIDWTRWSHLQTLGWRNCWMSETMRSKLNTGR